MSDRIDLNYNPLQGARFETVEIRDQERRDYWLAQSIHGTANPPIKGVLDGIADALGPPGGVEGLQTYLRK